MRRSFRALVLAGLTLGMLGGDIARLSFEPEAAEARWRSRGGFGYGYGYGYGYRGHHGHFGYYRHGASVGDVIATAAVIAGVAVVASSIQRDRRDRDDGGWDDGDGSRSDRRSDRREDIAVDECRDEAERQARRYGSSASISDIYDVDSRGSEVRVRGLVEIATTAAVASGSERRLATDRFTCIVRGGLVESYQLGQGSFASRD